MRYMHLKRYNGKRVNTVGYEWNKETGVVQVAPLAYCGERDHFCRKVARMIVEGRLKKGSRQNDPGKFIYEFKLQSNDWKELSNILISFYHPQASERNKAREWLDKQQLKDIEFIPF